MYIFHILDFPFKHDYYTGFNLIKQVICCFFYFPAKILEVPKIMETTFENSSLLISSGSVSTINPSSFRFSNYFSILYT